MADLESLIRLRRHTVEEKQKILADILREIEKIEARKEELNERLKKEREAMEKDNSLETREYFGRFQGVIRDNIAKMKDDLLKLETRLNLAQEEVRNAFADMKRVEIVDNRRKEEERAEINRKEQAELDEIGLETYRRSDDF